MLKKVDVRILRSLRKNARTSIADISRKVELTENAVRYRIERLEQMGYIRKYTVKLDPVRFGKGVEAIIMLRFTGKRLKEHLRRLSRYEELTSVYSISGAMPALVIGHFGDLSDLESFITERLLEDLPVSDYTVMPVLNVVKEEEFRI